MTEEESQCQKSAVVIILYMIGMEQVLEAPGPADIVVETRAKNCSEVL